MDEHIQTAGDFLDGRHAKAAARIAALEEELAERTRERDDLRYEKRARSAIDPNERLHNLCDGLAASRRESPYDQESWDLADACNRELQAELAAKRERWEAAEKDAARYRWLRNNCRDSWYEAGAKEEPVQLIHYTPHENIHGWEERLDAAIDAARKERT